MSDEAPPCYDDVMAMDANATLPRFTDLAGQEDRGSHTFPSVDREPPLHTGQSTTRRGGDAFETSVDLASADEDASFWDEDGPSHRLWRYLRGRPFVWVANVLSLFAGTTAAVQLILVDYEGGPFVALRVWGLVLSVVFTNVWMLWVAELCQHFRAIVVDNSTTVVGKVSQLVFGFVFSLFIPLLNPALTFATLGLPLYLCARVLCLKRKVVVDVTYELYALVFIDLFGLIFNVYVLSSFGFRHTLEWVCVAAIPLVAPCRVARVLAVSNLSGFPIYLMPFYGLVKGGMSILD